MALQHTPMYMKDWINRLDGILQMNGRELLTNAGEISHKMALDKSNLEFENYKKLLKESERKNNLKELENDLKRIKKTNK